MKKIRILGIIAIIVALVSLTGCDKILEVFYPEFGAPTGGGSGTNAAGIYVEIELPAGKTDINPQIAAVVEDAYSGDWVGMPVFMWPNWNWDDQGNVVLSAYLELYGIPSNTDYRIIVWQERTVDGGNGYPDFDEPSREAVWHPAGSQDPNNIFRFDDPNMTWIEGEAFLKIFDDGGVPMIRDFMLGGPRVFNVGEFASYPDKNWTIIPVDPNAPAITDINYTLWTPYEPVSGSETIADGTPADFAIDFTGFVTGDYWMDVEIRYDDDWHEYKGFAMRVLDSEEPYGTPYSAEITAHQVVEPPLSVATDNGDVYWEATILKAYGSDEIQSGSATLTTDGDIVVSLTGLTYDPTDFTDTAGDGVDMLDLAIDTNGDATIDELDFHTVYPLGLSTDDMGQLMIEVWSGDFRPIPPPPMP